MNVLSRRGPGFSMALPRCKNRPRSGVDICLPAVGAAPRVLCTDLKNPKSIVRMTLAEALINAPEFTVSELSSALRRTVEDAYGHVRVRGEISGFRGPHSSGHCYFALKDDSAKIEAVILKTAPDRVRLKPQEGLEVIATGRLTTYSRSAKYQIVIEANEPARGGAPIALLGKRKR